MKLPPEIEAMLAGEMGPAKKWAVEHQLQVGRMFDAEDMVAVSQAHMMADPESTGEAGVELVEGLRPALARKSGAVVLLCSNSAPMMPGDEEFIETLIAGDEKRALEIAEKIAPGSHYMQTKRALNYWMRRNIMAYGREGIRMNAIAPGPTLTPMTRPLFESEEYAPIMKALLDETPVNRAAEAEEISSCIEFLLSPAASNVYGTLLFADGGYDAHTRPDHV